MKLASGFCRVNIGTHRKYSGGTHRNTSQNVPPVLTIIIPLYGSLCIDAATACAPTGDAGVQRLLIWPARDELRQVGILHAGCERSINAAAISSNAAIGSGAAVSSPIFES